MLTDDSQRFKKMIFRATKGNNWTITKPMTNPKQEEQGEFDLDQKKEEWPSKTIFMVVYTSGTNNLIKNKLNRICDVFQSSK